MEDSANLFSKVHLEHSGVEVDTTARRYGAEEWKTLQKFDGTYNVPWLPDCINEDSTLTPADYRTLCSNVSHCHLNRRIVVRGG